MASLRKLPSGNWQASVLLDSGRRLTKTFPTAVDADDWAARTEAQRDAERAARSARSADDDIALHVAALERYAQDGLLRAGHFDALRRILDHDTIAPAAKVS